MWKIFSCKKLIIEKILHLSAAQAPKILSRKRRPNLGRLTVSPEMHSPRASGDRSRQKPQLPAKAQTLWGAGKDGGCCTLVLREEDRLVLSPGEFFMVCRCLCFYVMENCLKMKGFKNKLLDLGFLFLFSSNRRWWERRWRS